MVIGKIALVFGALLPFVLLGYDNSAKKQNNAPPVLPNATETCTMAMYGNDTAAYWACLTQFAHQANWFPSPIAGLFSYEIWNGYDGFWQNGAVLETMTNFLAYTNKTHTRFISVIQNGWRELYSLMEAYGPYPSFDDMGWYGLAYARVYEVLGTEEFLQTAEDVFNWCWQTGWDTTNTCGGGFWFDNTKASKQTITNVELLQLAAKLYRLTNTDDYKNKMNQIFEYIMQNDLIDNTTYMVSDSAMANCTPSDDYFPTYNAGVFIGALAEMYKVTNKTFYLDLGYKLANGVLENYCNSDGILVEPCEPDCDKDALMYKGLFVRNLRYLIDVLDDDVKANYLRTWINIQVESNLNKNVCFKYPVSKCNITFQDGPAYFKHSVPVFSQDWRGPFTVGNPMHQTSILDLLVSAIKPDTVCKGKYCDFDPSVPPPQPLTCGSHPCPTDEDCCEYSPYTTYTCCAEGQHCNTTTGICI